MTADVYAVDEDLTGVTPAVAHAGRFEFTVTADADPDVLARLANALMFANVAPSRVELSQDGAGIVTCRVEIRELAAALAELIRRKLLQLTCVIDARLASLATDSSPGPAP
jgi:hypothetical protein